MFERIKRKKGMMPKHVAITADGMLEWSQKNDTPAEDAFRRSLLIIKSTIKSQIKNNIPITTCSMLHKGHEKDDKFAEMVDGLSNLFRSLSKDRILHGNQVKLSFLGKWYDLPARLVDAVKEAIEETKEYDRFFLNFCLNYHGQEEIVDACRLIARQVSAEKIDPGSLSASTIKENLYSSYFLPPDLIIKNGKEIIPDILLWDHAGACIHFTGKLFPEFGKEDLDNALKYFKR
ncbi:hypothetical protein GF351_00090 [Candidatus Woesearchaeota archaeon]|nr:hypothetical protein [Candidatus Woesearchaeota archaeon]